MEETHPLIHEQISLEDWKNTPSNVRHLMDSLLINAGLSESKSHLIQFLDATPIGIAVHNSMGQLIYINYIGRSLLGSDRASESETAILSEKFQIYRTSSEVPYPIEELPSTLALAGKTTKVDDLEIHCPDRIVPLEVSATPIFDDRGKVIYAIVLFQDISDRKQLENERNRAETALKESELKLRNLTDAVPGAVYQFRLSAEGVSSMIFMSQGVRALGGISPEQAINDIQVVWDLIVPEDLEPLHQSTAISAQTLQPWNHEFRIQTTSGEIKWILGKSIPHKQENGEIIWNGILTDITARQQAKAALEKSEQRFRKLFESTPMISVQGYNRYRQVIYWNEASEQLYGYTKAEALGQQIEGLIVPPEMQQEVVALIQNWLVNGQQVPAGELSLVRKDGSRVAVYSSHIMLINPEGEQEMYCVDIDLSDRQAALRDRERAEEELRRAVAKNQALIDTIPDLILRVNRDGYYIDAIPSDEIEAAYPLDLVIGKCILDVLPPERAQERMYYLERAFQTGETQFHEYQILLNGKWQYEEARIVVSGNNEATILIRDITDRKKAEASLRESEERYRLLAENINDLVCLHHYDGRYLYVSPSCKALLGYREDEMLGQSPYLFFHPDDHERIRQEAHASALGGKAAPITYRMRQKSGNYIWFETLTNSIMDATGQVIQLQTTSRDVTERIQAQNQLKYDALHDALTGLPNRNLLIERLELSMHRAKRGDNYHFAVLFLDLDRFKVINDSLGHIAGDKLLIVIAQKLQATFREIDLVARLGGDEFVILLDEIKDMQEAIHATERIFAGLTMPLTIEGREVYTTASIGIVLGTNEYTQATHLLRDADIAMYRAKNSGKAKYEIFDAEMHRQALDRMHLENDLRRAIECQEFVMYYQPIIALENGYIVGFEALIRWQHPTQGLKYPVEFITIAEEIGLIASISSWALRTACHQLASWQTTFPELSTMKISINLSAQDLKRSDLLKEVDLVLSQTNLAACNLTLEITESMLIEDVESTIRLFSQLKERGIQISIDDFGTGYSSLNYLHRLPMDNLKVDRSFVNQIQEGKKNYQIVETIATLSAQLELETFAEGIETIQQLEQLQNLGYKFGQGYLFSKPISKESVEVLLASNNLCLFPSNDEDVPNPYNK